MKTVKTHNYRHTENISLDSESNRYYSMKILNRNSQTHAACLHVFKHPGVMKQIHRMTYLFPSNLTTTKKSTKIKFSSDEIIFKILYISIYTISNLCLVARHFLCEATVPLQLLFSIPPPISRVLRRFDVQRIPSFRIVRLPRSRLPLLSCN